MRVMAQTGDDAMPPLHVPKITLKQGRRYTAVMLDGQEIRPTTGQPTVEFDAAGLVIVTVKIVGHGLEVIQSEGNWGT